LKGENSGFCPRHPPRLLIDRSAAANAQVVDRVFNETRLKVGRLSHEAAGCDHLVDDEAGLKGGKIEAFFSFDLVDDGVERLVGKLHTLPFALPLEDAAVARQGGRTDLDLVGKAT